MAKGRTKKLVKTCITCNDYKTCPDSLKPTRKAYLTKGNDYVCRKWRANRNVEELEKWNRDAKVRLTPLKREPFYKTLLTLDPDAQDIRARDIISRIPNFSQAQASLQRWANKLSKGYVLTQDDLDYFNRMTEPIHTECMTIRKTFKKKIKRSDPIEYKNVYKPAYLKQGVSSDPIATCYAELLNDYLNNVLNMNTCLECGEPTPNPKYCNNKCSDRARQRRHRSE